MNNKLNQLNYHQCDFLTSVANLATLPADQGAEVAFIGRSNVGKSSTLNALTNQKKLALISKTPGRTRLINFFALTEQCRLVDLPGYGYAKVAKSIKFQWETMLADYLLTRKCLRGLILIIDARHLSQSADWFMIQWLIDNNFNIPVHLVLNKADKLSRMEQKKKIVEMQAKLTKQASGIITSCQLFSAVKRDGVIELVNKLDSWIGV